MSTFNSQLKVTAVCRLIDLLCQSTK